MNLIPRTPEFGTHLNTEYILGKAKTEGKVKILPYVDTVLITIEIQAIERNI